MADNDGVKLEDYNALREQVTKLDERAKRMEGLATDYQKQLESFKGIDPEKYRALIEDYDNLKKSTVKTPQEIDEFVKSKEHEIRSQYQKQQDELKSKYDTTSRELHELKVVDRALEQVGGIFNEDMFPFVKEQIRREIDRDEEGNFIVKGKDGKAAYSAKEPAKTKTLSEWAAEIAERHPSMVRSTAKGGAFQKGESSNGAGSLDAKRYLDAVARGTTGDIPLAERGKMAMEVLNKTPFKL